MRLLVYEFKKSFCKIYILIFLIVFSLVNLGNIYISYNIHGVFNGDKGLINGYNNVYKNKLKGKLTDEKILFVINEEKRLKSLISQFNYSSEYDEETYTGYIFGDYTLFEIGFYKPIKYNYDYLSYSTQIIDQAKKNIDFFTNKNNLYQRNRNKNIVKLYSERKITSFFDLDGFEFLIKYDFSSFLILSMCILGLVPVFVAEKEIGMDVLLKISSNGYKKIVISKLNASFSYIILLSIWFYTLDMIMFQLRFRLEGFNSPIYAIQNFKQCPINVTVFQFYIINNALRVVGIVFLCTIFLVLSIIFYKTIDCFIFSVICFMGITSISGQKLIIDGVNMGLFNPGVLLKSREMFYSYETCNIFNLPVNLFIIKVIVAIIYITVNIAYIVKKNNR